MDVGGKILTGAMATALLALVGHYVTGDRYIAGLENAAQTEMAAQGMEDVKITFARAPLSRKAVLDGDVTDDIKQKALNAVSAMPGISSAVWTGSDMVASAGAGNSSEAGNGKGDGGHTDVDPATQVAVAKCQGGVDKAIEGQKLSFRSGSAYVSPASNSILDEVAAALEPCSGLAVTVGGHTDDNGNAQVNKILSQERADRVRGGLIDRGISENLITAIGFGAEQPLAASDGPEADAQNRRIEFKVQAADKNETNDANSQQEE